MIEHSIEDILTWKQKFRDDYSLTIVTISPKKPVEYFILPQKLNNNLPDFILRLTNSNFKQDYVIGVSDSVPFQIRDYFALAEYIEFMEKGINTPNRVVDSEKEVLNLIPENLKGDYLERKIGLFKRELELDLEMPDKFQLGEDGRLEFEKAISYLMKELIRK